jgi:ElaB/YqjD/DUF883 family membrane-anchored ribosome-binding protein
VTHLRRWNVADRISAVDGPLVDGARSVEATAGRIKDKVVGGAEEGMKVSREYISENPMTSVLVAVGVGTLLGFLLGRRTS